MTNSCLKYLFGTTRLVVHAPRLHISKVIKTNDFRCRLSLTHTALTIFSFMASTQKNSHGFLQAYEQRQTIDTIFLSYAELFFILGFFNIRLGLNVWMRFSGLLIRLLSWIKTFPSADIGISNHSLLKGGTRKNNTLFPLNQGVTFLRDTLTEWRACGSSFAGVSQFKIAHF